MELSPKKYNSIESEEVKAASLLQIQAYAPRAFEQDGFQTRISNEKEFWKYADSMHGLRFRTNIEAGLNNSLSQEEFDYFQLAVQRSLNFTKIKSGKPQIGHNTISRTFICTRVISKLLSNGLLSKNINILELGPGIGAQSATLVHHFQNSLKGFEGCKFNIITMDPTQAFYLYQNHYFTEYFKENFIESVGRSIDELNQIFKDISFDHEQIIHVPWWHFANNQLKLPKIDLIIANHMVSEMSVDSFRHTFSIARTGNKTEFDCPAPIVLLDCWGGVPDRVPSAMSDFLKIGFFPVHNLPLYKEAFKWDSDYVFGALIETDESFKENLKHKFEMYFKPRVVELFPDLKKLKTSAHIIHDLFLDKNFRSFMFFKTNHPISNTIFAIGKEQMDAISYDKIETFLISILETYHLESIYDTDEQFQNRCHKTKLLAREYINWYLVNK